MSAPTATAALRVAPVLDVPGSVETLARWGDDGLDRWDGRRLLRTVRDGSTVVPYLARPTGSVDDPGLEVTAPADGLPVALESLRTSFVVAPEALADLCVRDPVIARLDAAYPGVRPLLHRDPLTALVRSISAQQVNLPWATRIRHRLGVAYGVEHDVAGEAVRSLDAARIAAASLEGLRALQLTTAKARSLVAVAQAVLEGALELPDLTSLDDAAVAQRLVALPGIGPWTADWFLARSLGRPRVVAGDLGVRKAVGRLYLEGRLPSESEVRSLTEHWGAAAGIAQQLVLHDLAARPGVV